MYNFGLFLSDANSFIKIPMFSTLLDILFLTTLIKWNEKK